MAIIVSKFFSKNFNPHLIFVRLCYISSKRIIWIEQPIFYLKYLNDAMTNV